MSTRTFEEIKRELREVRATIIQSVHEEEADVVALRARHAEYRAKLTERFAALAAELTPDPPRPLTICVHPARTTVFDQDAKSGEVVATCGHCGEKIGTYSGPCDS